MRTPECPCQQRMGITHSAENSVPPSASGTASVIASQSSVHHRRRPFHNIIHHSSAFTEESAANSDGDSSITQHPDLERIPSDVSSVGSLYRNNTLFARLISGQESEQGEAPPQYEQVVSFDALRSSVASTDVVPAQS